MEDGCEADLLFAEVSDSTQVGPLPETMVGGLRVWDLRNCKHVVIPEGTEGIRRNWFWGSNVESVEILASVKCIGTNAFYKCENLKRIVFAEGSRLERIGNYCFCHSGIEELTLPGTLREIGGYAFDECDNLKTIYVEDGCEASLADA